MSSPTFRSLVLVLSCLLAACAGRTNSAPTLPDGNKIAIVLLPDRGITPDIDAERAKQLNDLGHWMEGDLVDILNKTGYSATRSNDDSIHPGPGRYVLRVKISNYDAGSKAQRILLGFGAGAARLDTHFELIGQDNAVALAGDPSVASGRDWTNAARKINLNTVDSVNAYLRRAH